MMKKIEITLRNLGFSANEAKVYLATLEVGPASAQDIAVKAEIVRTTGYSVLENLVLRGIIYKTKKENKNRYFAESPKNLALRLSRHQKHLQESIPELEAIYNKREIKPKVVFFEGLDGLKKIYEDTIKSKPKEILEFNTSEMFETFPDFPMDYVEQRKVNKIKAKRIAPDDKNWQKHASLDKSELSTTLLLPNEEFQIPVEINIYNNKVAFISYSDKMGIIIEGEGIAQAMRKIYELFWKSQQNN